MWFISKNYTEYYKSNSERKSDLHSRLIIKKGSLRQLLLLRFYQLEIINFLCVKIYLGIVSWEFLS